MRTKVFVILIILLGLGLRFYHLDKIAAFDYDQEVAANWVKNLVVDHKFSLIGQETSVSGVYIAPFFYYLLAPVYFFSGMNPFAANIFVVCLSVLTLIYLYKWSKSLIVIFLYAIHPGLIIFNQTVAPSSLVFVIAAGVGYYLTKINKKFYDYLILGLFLGLTFSAHPPSVLLIPLTLLLFIRQKEKLRNYFFVLVPVFILVSPLLVFELKHGFLISRNILAIQTHGYDFLFFARILANVKLFLLYFAGMIVSSDAWFIQYPLMIVAAWLFFRVNDLLFRLWFLLPLIFIMIYPRPAPEYYLQVITPLAIIYAVKYLPKILIPAIIILSVVSSYLALPKRDNQVNLQYKTQAAHYLATKNPAVIYFSTDLGQGWGFNYLFWWQGIKLNSANDKYQIIIPASREPLTEGILFGAIKVTKIN
ncbi:MAG: hypothetical protein AAB838_01120 [Patescibacteria group bacterium]